MIKHELRWTRQAVEIIMVMGTKHWRQVVMAGAVIAVHRGKSLAVHAVRDLPGFAALHACIAIFSSAGGQHNMHPC